MENNFYVGVVSHEKGITHDTHNEKVVLYTENNVYYTDLLKEKTYSTDSNEKDYVIEDTLIEANVNDFRVDYIYLLNKYKENGRNAKKRKFDFIKNTR